MKTHKKVTYTLDEDTLLHIDITILILFGEGKMISKSAYIKNCLINSFDIFEKEIEEENIEKLSRWSKKYEGTKPMTVTLPFEVVEKLDFYSQVLKMKKSHLVMCSVLLNEEYSK
ncbi:hypothetical protein [Sulfurimonas sp.]